MRAGERADQTRLVVEVRLHDFDPAGGQRPAPRDPGLRVMARGVKPPSGSSRIARMSPPPWAPVAPVTARILDMSTCFLLVGGVVDMAGILLTASPAAYPPLLGSWFS